MSDKIRPATSDDLPAIMRLERAMFPTDAWSEEAMAAELASPHNVYLVTEHAGSVVAYAGARILPNAPDGDIQTIAVDHAVQGRGRGRALLRTLLSHAADNRVQEIFLDVRDDNPVAVALYRSEGFVEIGRRARYYQPDDVDAIVMRLTMTSWNPDPTADMSGAC